MPLTALLISGRKAKRFPWAQENIPFLYTVWMLA